MGGRVRWVGRWYRLKIGGLSLEDYEHLPQYERTWSQPPKYDGRMDGSIGLFYDYGPSHPMNAVFLHSIVGAEWPGPACVSGVFCWETFEVEA